MSAMTAEGPTPYEEIEARLLDLLPAQYHDCYEELQPVSMGSAGLKYGDDGKVAWNEIWGSFCTLAMAGGPPHKGALLEPAPATDIEAQPLRYREVVDEICRGITMVTGLPAHASTETGWIRVVCRSEGMAGWLLRAIVMENVSVRLDGASIYLPAGPQYRLEKEIKNVITVVAKTCHYWLDHIWRPQQSDIADLLEEMQAESPLIVPAPAALATSAAASAAACQLSAAVHQHTRLRASTRCYAGWLGLECPTVAAAVWMMRTMVACNVLARREDSILFVPINPETDPDARIVTRALLIVHGVGVDRSVVC